VTDHQDHAERSGDRLGADLPTEQRRLTMRWFRSKMQFGSRLALVALALQIVLTFGHVHSFVPTAVDTALSSAAPASDGSSSRDRSRNGLADVDCRICALINLTGISMLSVAPDLPLPASVDFVILRPRAELASATAPHFQPKARASPSI
jgi:hypothetical protein